MLTSSHQAQSLDSAMDGRGGRNGGPLPLFPGTVSPIHGARDKGETCQTLEEDTLSDLTLVGEGDINSPCLNYVTPSPLPCKPQSRARDRPSSGTSPA